MKLSIHVPEEGGAESEREEMEVVMMGVEWGSSVSEEEGKGRG